MHVLSFRLFNPVVEGTNDHGRLVHHITFDAELIDGAIRAGKEFTSFDVTVHAPPRDPIASGHGIRIEQAFSEEASIDVTFDDTVIERLMHLRADDGVTLLLRFNKGGVNDEHGAPVFESAGHPNAIDWYAIRALEVPHAFSSIQIVPGGASPQLSSVGDLGAM